MAIRTLTIPPFVDPGDGTIDPMLVTIDLVDQDNRRISGLLSPDGDPIADRLELSIGATEVTQDLWPQSDIQGLPEYGSSAPADTYYLVSLERKSTRFRSRIRTQVAAGGALSWLEFMSGAGTVVPPGLTLEEIIQDVITALETAGRLLPVPANEGDVLVYTGGAWTATDTLSGGGA